MKEQTAMELFQAVARRWVARREEQGLKRGTVRCRDRQLEFFIGAASAARAACTPFADDLLILLAVGRDAEDFLPKDDVKAAPARSRRQRSES